MKLTKPQRGVAAGMAAGVVITVLVFAGAAAFVQSSGLSTSRLQLFVVSVLLPVLALAFAIARLAAHRFWTPQDLDGSGLSRGTNQARLLQALIQNTLEQLVLAMPAYSAWVMLAPAWLLGVVPAAAVLFVIGRVLFFRGYERGAAGRALGFSLTFYPTVLLLAGAVALVVVWACR